MIEEISIREFARREGVTHKAVADAIKRGRLSKLRSGKMDAALVGTEWCSKNVIKSLCSISENDLPELNISLRRKEAALAALREIELQKVRGDIVDIRTVQDCIFENARGAMSAWRQWPQVACHTIAAAIGFDKPEVIMAALEAAVHEQLVRMSADDWRAEAQAQYEQTIHQARFES